MTQWLLLSRLLLFVVLVVVNADLDLVNDIRKRNNNNNNNVFDREIISPRIVGGFPSGPGAYPFHVHSYDGDQGLCSGVLIHPDIVVTAASCQTVFETTNQVYVGSNDLLGRDFAPQIAITLILPHPNYNDSTLENDILLLLLETPVSSAVASIGNVMPSEDQLMFTLGFGRQSPLDETFSTTRNEVDMPLVGFLDCEAVYGDAVNADQQICAGIPGMGPCTGDEGGPLLDAVTTELQGIWSFSEGCGAAPAVFTRVTYYDELIQTFVCDNSQMPPEDCTPGTDDENSSTDDDTSHTDDDYDGGNTIDDDDEYVSVDTPKPSPAPTHGVVYPSYNGKGKGRSENRSKNSSRHRSYKKKKSYKKSKKSSSGKRSSGKGSYGKGSSSSEDSSYGKGSYGKGSYGKGSSGKGSDGKGSYGKGSSGKGSEGKGSFGKGSYSKGSYGKGSSGKGSSGKGSEGKGSHGKGSSGKKSYGKGSDGKGSYGKGSLGNGSSGKGSYGKGSTGNGSYGKGSIRKESSYTGDLYQGYSIGTTASTKTYGRTVDVSNDILQNRHNRSPSST